MNFVVALLALSLFRAGDTPKLSEASSERVDSVVKQAMAKHHIPGLSIAVVRDGKIAMTNGYGFANLESMRRASPESIYQLASVSKQFTATAVMKLVESGKVSLDEPIHTYLKDTPEAWNRVTVRHLLTHTSGIKSYTEVPNFFANGNQRKDYAHKEIIDLVRNSPLDFEPGTQWHYNNTGFYLLGMLIEEVSGQSYEQFLTQWIFKPLGMSHTRLNNRAHVIPERVAGYSWDGKDWANAEFVSPTQPFSAGALTSNVLDMAKWDAALYTNKILKKESLQQMWTRVVLKSGEKADYGFGWAITEINKHRDIQHGGGIDGFSTQVSRFLDDKLTIIVLTNSDGGRAEKVANEVAALYVPALKVTVSTPKAIVDDNIERTKLFKEILLEAAQGRANADLFAPATAQALVPRIQEGKQMFASFGEMKSFVLTEKREKDGTTLLRYHVTYSSAKVNVTYVVNKEGKIVGLNLQPGE